MVKIISKSQKKFLNFQKKPYIYLLDFQLVFFSYILSFLLRFDFVISYDYLKTIIYTFPFIFIIKVTFYIVFKLDKILWRYTSVKDLIAIIKSSIFSNLTYTLLLFFIIGPEGFPRSIIIIDAFLYVFFLGGFRLAYRVYFKMGQGGEPFANKKCFILGSGDAAEFLIREMVTNHHVDYNPLGILDDNSKTWNRIIHGVKILGPINKLYEYAKQYQIEEIIIAIPSASTKEMKRIVEYCEACRDLGVTYKTVPGLNEILSGHQSPIAIRDIKLEDLINRELVVTNKIDVRNELINKIILVTGAAGSIGSELVRQLVDCKPSLIVLIDRNENNLMYLEKELQELVPFVNIKSLIVDITDKLKLEKVFQEIKPNYVFHAAAYKHVSYMETGPDEAVKNNVYGTYLLAQFAEKYHVTKFVMISTDKAVSPTSVMGCSKRVAELSLINLFEKAKTSFVIVRFGNVIGSEGSVVPIFQKQIKNGGPVTVTDQKMRRYFMTIPEAVRLTLQAGHIGDHRDILILDMGEQIPIVEIAENLITLSGLKPYIDIPIKFTGAKPGEKLYEELWNQTEKPIVTNHPKIFKTSNTSSTNGFEAEIFFQLIDASLEHSDSDTIKRMLKKLVPTFHYNDDFIETLNRSKVEKMA